MLEEDTPQKRYRRKHPDRVRDSEKRYFDNHPEARERKRQRAKEFSKQYRASSETKAKRQAYQREYRNRPEVRERERLRARRRFNGMRDYQRRRHLAITYGISPELWAQMWREQEGLCAICRTREAKCVDHNHLTGATRQLLCHHCNMALGLMEDSPKWLMAASEYLNAHHQITESTASRLPGF